MSTMERILRLMSEKKASDVYLSANAPALIKINGECIPINNQVLPPDAPRNLLSEIVPAERIEELEETGELNMAKKQFIAQLAISMESNEGYMLGAGKSFLAHREVDTMEEVYRKIQALTAEDLTAVASSVFSSPSRLIYK